MRSISRTQVYEQAMLLKAIEEKRFLPMGADKETQSDFQLIAGTNRDLRDDVRAGRFREDLLARINMWTFVLPALRERPEDIEHAMKPFPHSWRMTRSPRWICSIACNRRP